MSTNYLVENNVLVPTTANVVATGADSYEGRFGISINGNNGLYLSFWIHKNGQKMINDLGTCSYQIYDADHNELVAFTESGITADANGLFRATPIVADELIDLTHFIIDVSIYADSDLRTSSWPFNLGE